MTLFDPPDPMCSCGSPCTLGMVHSATAPCFVYVEPDVAHLRFVGHSSTSKRAALFAYPRTGFGRDTVLNFLLRRADGATDEEIEDGTGMNPSSQRPRRIELVEGGWVRAALDDHGAEIERPTRSGAMAQVWEATDKARAHGHAS